MRKGERGKEEVTVELKDLLLPHCIILFDASHLMLSPRVLIRHRTKAESTSCRDELTGSSARDTVLQFHFTLTTVFLAGNFDWPLLGVPPAFLWIGARQGRGWAFLGRERRCCLSQTKRHTVGFRKGQEEWPEIGSMGGGQEGCSRVGAWN